MLVDLIAEALIVIGTPGGGEWKGQWKIWLFAVVVGVTICVAAVCL